MGSYSRCGQASMGIRVATLAIATTLCASQWALGLTLGPPIVAGASTLQVEQSGP